MPNRASDSASLRRGDPSFHELSASPELPGVRTLSETTIYKRLGHLRDRRLGNPEAFCDCRTRADRLDDPSPTSDLTGRKATQRLLSTGRMPYKPRSARAAHQPTGRAKRSA